MSNTLTGFVFENHIAHGAFVELSTGVGEMLSHRDYGADVRALIGEAMAAMPLLATHLRFEGRINLQFQGDGGRVGRAARPDAIVRPHMQLLVAQIDHHLNVRGMAKAPPGLSGNFTELLYGGVLALMLEPNNAPGREQRPASQAIVLIQGARLSDALEGYFAQSEQLPTLIRLAARDDRLCGFMLQRLPLEHTQATQEDWEHLATLAGTLGDEELLNADASTLIRRLFANETVRVFEPRPVTVTCRCNRGGISTMLMSLGRDEVDSIVAEQGKVEVTCEFCGRQYQFSPGDIGALFAAAGAQPRETRH
jgi:molecular chaperone Hsp33